MIASDRGSLPEVLGGAGELFDPRDGDSLCNSLRRVLKDERHRQDLRARSLGRAGNFTWARSARQAMDVFHEFRPS